MEPWGFGPMANASPIRFKTTSDRLRKRHREPGTSALVPGARPMRQSRRCPPPPGRRPVGPCRLGVLSAATSPSRGVRPSRRDPSTSLGFARGPTPHDAEPTPAAATPPDPATIYRAIEEQVASDPRPPAEGRRSIPRSSTRLTSSKPSRTRSSKDNPRGAHRGERAPLKALGLLPPDASLEDLYIEPARAARSRASTARRTRQLYVVSRSGGLGPTREATFAHEYTHALQDQNFDLRASQLDAPGRATGRSPAWRSSRATRRC